MSSSLTIPISPQGMPPMKYLSELGIGVAIAIASCSAALAGPHDHGAPIQGAPPPFMASTAKPFDALMGDAMAVMDYGMRTAPMNGEPDHDFVTMMIPHHQGAIDMAKALLLHTQDPELRNLALGIVTEQQNEIRLMNAWLARKGRAPAANPLEPPKGVR
jgi:hypothetical protein